MIDNNIIELINKEADGVASPSEAAHLMALSAENPEILSVRNDMRLLADAIAHMKRAEPPSMLKGSIMRAIEASHPRRKRSLRIGSALDALWAGTFGKPGLIFAGGIAAGFLLFFLTSTVLPTRSIGDAELTGTLVLTGEAPGFTAGQTINVDRDAVKGTVETQFAPGLCLVRLNLEAPEGVSASIVTDPSVVHLEALRPSDDSGARVSVCEGEIASGGSKEGRLVALFAVKGKSLSQARIMLISSGKTIFEGDVPLASVN